MSSSNSDGPSADYTAWG